MYEDDNNSAGSACDADPRHNRRIWMGNRDSFFWTFGPLNTHMSGLCVYRVRSELG